MSWFLWDYICLKGTEIVISNIMGQFNLDFVKLVACILAIFFYFYKLDNILFSGW